MVRVLKIYKKIFLLVASVNFIPGKQEQGTVSVSTRHQVEYIYNI